MWELKKAIKHVLYARASAENFPEGGGGKRKKDRKLAKKYRKIALFAYLRGGGATEKITKISKKRPKNNTFKPLSTIFVSCLKIQGATAPSPADAHDCTFARKLKIYTA